MKFKKIFAVVLSIVILTGCAKQKSDTANVNQEGEVKNQAVSGETKPQSWGQGKQVDDNNCPISCKKFQEKYSDLDSIFIGDTSKKNIMLTFDQGYENGYTTIILDILKEKQVKVVFFLTGDYVDKNEDLIKRMIDEGHIIGNHTEKHPSMPKVSAERMKEEISSLDKKVNEKFGISMDLFRPPMGEFSEQSLKIAKEMGCKTIFWSFAYADWDTKKQLSKETALSALNSHMHSGAIYLLHSVSKTNAEVLGEWIDNAKSEGYTFDINL